MNYAKFKPTEDYETMSFSDLLDANQVKIQLFTIYAGVIGVVFEGKYSNNILPDSSSVKLESRTMNLIN